jgi:aminocarboxymuconate-semialdehyde decarboxylase
MAVAGSPCIDTHSHWMPPAQLAAVRRWLDDEPALRRDYGGMLALADRSPSALTDIDLLFAQMDTAGVDTSAIALPPPAATFGPVSVASAVAADGNDAMLAAAERSGGRLAVLVALPVPHVDAAMAELERTAPHPAARGVSVLTMNGDWTIDEPRFEPLWRRAAELGFPLVLHPSFDCRPQPFTDWTIGGTLHAVMSSSLSVARLVQSGMLDRLPDLDVIVPHLGGTIPYLAQRFGDMGNGAAGHDMPYYLRSRLYLDTCSYHPPAFRCALETAGADRLVLGTDYPFRGTLARGVDDVRSNAPDDESCAAILGGTAARWFG